METIVTMEIRNTQVRVMKMKVTGRKMKLLSCFRFQIPAGLVEDGYIRETREVAKVVKSELAKRKLGNVKKVAFTIFSNRIAGREIELPFVKEKRLQEMIEVNASEYFPVDISQYIVSYDIIDIIEDKEKNTEKKYRLMVYITPKTLIKGYKELANLSGLTIEKINYSSHNGYRAIEKSFEKGTHLIMKIEEDETNITIMRDGTLALQRTLSYGVGQAIHIVSSRSYLGARGDDEKAWSIVSENICLYDTFDQDQLDTYKEKDEEETWEIKCDITESLRYLVSNVARIMDYYTSRNNGIEFDSIQFGGIGSEIQGLSNLFSNELHQDVQPLKDLVGIPYTKDLSEQGDGIGTYLSCIGCISSKMNILASDTSGKKSKSESLTGVWLIFGAGIVASIALIGTSVTLKVMNRYTYRYLDKEIEKRQEAQVIYNNYLNAKANVTQLEDIYNKTVAPNEYLVAFIEEMEEKMPSSIRIDSLSSTESGVNFSVKVATKEEAADVLINLRTFASLSTVTTSGIREEASGEVSFDVICTYNPVNMWKPTEESSEAN